MTSSSSIIDKLRMLCKERDDILHSISQYEDILSITRLMDIINSPRIFPKILSIETINKQSGWSISYCYTGMNPCNVVLLYSAIAKEYKLTIIANEQETISQFDVYRISANEYDLRIKNIKDTKSNAIDNESKVRILSENENIPEALALSVLFYIKDQQITGAELLDDLIQWSE